MSGSSWDFAALLPGVGVFGGVRRFLEIGNELVRRGHSYTIYHTDGARPDWLKFAGEVRPLADVAAARHQILITNDTANIDAFAGANADLKLFYFVLENIRGERAIATNREWTLIANSSGMYERLRAKYRVPVWRVIGGINLDIFKPGDRGAKDELRILSFGRVSRKKKGVPLVVKAVEGFARKYGNVRLVLFDHVGFGNEQDPREEIKTAVPTEFHLNLSQPDLAALYATCDMFVSAERRAGWANTVAESMATGVPVVCTASGTRDIAIPGKTAQVVKWRHPWFIRRGIDALYNDADATRGMADAAREHIQSYSWPKVVDQLEAVVKDRLR